VWIGKIKAVELSHNIMKGAE